MKKILDFHHLKKFLKYLLKETLKLLLKPVQLEEKQNFFSLKDIIERWDEHTDVC